MYVLITPVSASGKHNVTVWRPSVRPSVRLSVCFVGILAVTRQGATFDAASVHFGPTITRADICLYINISVIYFAYPYTQACNTIICVIITGPPTYSKRGQTSAARWRLSSVVVCNTPRRRNVAHQGAARRPSSVTSR